MSSDLQNTSALETDPQWHQLLFRDSFQMAWVYDIKTLQFIDVNEAAIERLGYSREQFLSMSLKDIRPPEDVPALLDSVDILEVGRRLSGEWRHRAADGSIVYSEIASFDFQLPNDPGRRARLAIITDVTERHIAEEALKQTINDYRGLFENAHDAILIISADDGGELVLDVNQRACDIYLYPRGELVGLRLATICKYPQRGREHHERVLKQGKPVHFETTQFRKDGSEMQLEINASIVTYQGRRAIMCIARDVTERKVEEQRRREEEQRRRLHVEQTPLGVIEWDTKFCVTAWNEGAMRIFGFTEQEALGRCGPEFLLVDSAKPHVHEIFDALLTSRGGLRSTNDNVTKDGRIIHCEWYNTPLVDADGKPVGVASLVQDVTEQQAIREAMESRERSFRALAESSPAIVFRADATGRMEYLNPRWYEMTGQAPDRVAADAWSEVVHPDDARGIIDRWEKGTEIRIRLHDGGYHRFRISAAPLRDPTNEMKWIGYGAAAI